MKIFSVIIAAAIAVSPLSAEAQSNPSPEAVRLYALLGALHMVNEYRNKGDWARACVTARQLQSMEASSGIYDARTSKIVSAHCRRGRSL
jgi:hypothetical protein